MLKIPTKSFSTIIFILGILLAIISFFAFIVSSASSIGVMPSLLSLAFSIILVAIGNKKIVDEDYLIIFIKDLINDTPPK